MPTHRISSTKSASTQRRAAYGILCAGHDEPILAVLSRQDRFEQVLRSRDWIRRRFGVDAPGLWLPNASGSRHWRANSPRPACTSCWSTIATFASPDLPAKHCMRTTSPNPADTGSISTIDEKLRYLIPFRPPVELAEYFRELRAVGHEIAVLGDDGEKFGGWPGTRKWLYEDGWLTAFLGTMRQLRDNDEVRLSRFEDALTTTQSGGLAYLPSASAGRWRDGRCRSSRPSTAPPGARVGRRADPGRGRAACSAGGHWRHFLVKSGEQRMLEFAPAALSGSVAGRSTWRCAARLARRSATRRLLARRIRRPLPPLPACGA